MDLKGLYREIVNEHNLRPSHKGDMENPDLVLRGVNPSCGDDITLQLKIVDGVIDDAMFAGSGCAISQASVDMMADQIIGRSKEDAIKLAGTFMGMIKGEIKDEEELEELVEFLKEGVDVLELAVNGGKPHVGHLVQVLQPVHDHFPDLDAGNLPLQGALQLLLDLIGDVLDGLGADRPLFAGLHETADDLRPVEALTAPVPLDHQKGQTLHDLIGGESLAAAETLPPAADGGALFGRSGINDLAFAVTAVRTAHGHSLPLGHGLLTHDL